MRACRHHGLPFSSDMDFTNPAGRLHLSQAALHPPVLEYHQGMWHLVIDTFRTFVFFQHDSCQKQIVFFFCQWL